MNRRKFVLSSGVAAIGTLLQPIPFLASGSTPPEGFQWKTSDLLFSFAVSNGRLRQKRFLPAGFKEDDTLNSSGVEVALQCSGENSPDQGMKSAMGQPGNRLLLDGHRLEPMRGGKRLVLTHTDPLLKLQVESLYEAIDGVPIVRRYSRIVNAGDSPVGIDFLSSAMLHGLA